MASKDQFLLKYRYLFIHYAKPKTRDMYIYHNQVCGYVIIKHREDRGDLASSCTPHLAPLVFI